MESNKRIKLTDIQNIIGDVFSIAGDTASLVGGKAGQALGVELNAIGLGIKAYGEATLGNQTISPDDLFNADNWKGFGWDLAERWFRQFYELFPDELNPWKDINHDGKYHIVDPLVLDLDGDGIETVGAQGYHGALFDHNKDGIRTATGWVSADDGLLVIDRNSDGLIDAQDEAFKQLRVWSDLNQDGISQENELFTLESLNIQSLNTAYQDVSTRLGNGNNHFYGGAGNDVLISGIGNDYLVGGEGRDTYIFVKGHGRDTVSNYDSGSISIDNLLFEDAESIHAIFSRSGNDLLVKAFGKDDQVTVQGYFYSENYRHAHFTFADKKLANNEIMNLVV